MKYFLDTAMQRDIDKWESFIIGVTSNPILLDRASIDAETFIDKNEIRHENIFVQVTSIEEAMLLGGNNKDQIIFKVPLLKTEKFNGYRLLKQLINSNFRTCATIVYDVTQFDYACEVGSEFSIVLYAKNENPMIMYQCSELKQKRNYETKIVAASFRSAIHVRECMLAGADYATVPPKVMEELFGNQDAIKDFEIFYEDK